MRITQVSCGADRATIIDYSITKQPNQHLLTSRNTLRPSEQLIARINELIDDPRKPMSLAGAKMIHHRPSVYTIDIAYKDALKGARDGDNAEIGGKVVRDTSVVGYITRYKAFFVALAAFALLIVGGCIFAATIVLR